MKAFNLDKSSRRPRNPKINYPEGPPPGRDSSLEPHTGMDDTSRDISDLASASQNRVPHAVGLKDKGYNMSYREADAKHMSDKLFRLAKVKARGSGDFYRSRPLRRSQMHHYMQSSYTQTSN